MLYKCFPYMTSNHIVANRLHAPLGYVFFFVKGYFILNFSDPIRKKLFQACFREKKRKESKLN